MGIRTSEIVQLVRGRFAAPEFAFFQNVGSNTGSVSQRADGIAMSLWKSRGLELHGIEIKASRSDWLRELKAPNKAERIFRFCDRWWLVVGDASIVKDGELPVNWGLLVVRGSQLVRKVDAPKLPAEPIDRSFMAGLLRSASETGAVAYAINKAYQAGVVEGRERESSATKHLQECSDRMAETIHKFQEASGICIDARWSRGEEVGKIVRLAMSGHYDKHTGELQSMLDRLKRITAAIERELDPCAVAGDETDD